MSEYTTESPASVAARQRRRRALITLGVVVLGLFFAFWYGLSYYRAASEPEAAPTPSATCRPYDPEAKEVASPADVTVDVYNATSRNGLAGRTAGLVEDRGFTIGKVANDPTDRKPPKVAEVRYGAKGRPEARAVLAIMPEGTRGVSDKRKDSSVSIALGTGFKALKPEGSSPQAPMCPAPSESPS